MATITIQYDGRNAHVKKVIEGMVALGLFTIKDESSPKSVGLGQATTPNKEEERFNKLISTSLNELELVKSGKLRTKAAKAL